jgi:electron transfer flavoprotein-quinone oxidoreductase
VPKKLYREGLVVVGDAGGFVIKHGSDHSGGLDLAIVSGLAAANAVLKAVNPAKVGPLYIQGTGNA